jgi:hypothetical protein
MLASGRLVITTTTTQCRSTIARGERWEWPDEPKRGSCRSPSALGTTWREPRGDGGPRRSGNSSISVRGAIVESRWDLFVTVR